MPKVLHCSYWLLVLVIILDWSMTATAQLAAYGQEIGIEQGPMCGSCAPSQESFGGPEWYGAGYETSDSDLFMSQCGCNGAMEVPGGDPGMQMPYPEQYGVQPYGYSDCGVMPGACDYPAPFGVQSGCGEYNSCIPGGYSLSPSGCYDPGACCVQQFCPCGNAAPWWFGAEALIWKTTSSGIPPMVTSSEPGTQQFDAGVLGRPTTQSLYGGGNIFGGTQGGYRLRGGHYVDPCGMSGVDAEFFMLGTRNANYHSDSTGDPILARPFLNAQTGLNDAQLVAFPDLASGTIDISAKSNLYSGALHYREVFWKDCDSVNGCSQYCSNGQHSSTMGFQIGPRFVNLRESFGSNERLTSLETAAQFQIQDSFRAKNLFRGCELGLFGSHQGGRWTLDGGVRLAIGATKQELDVSGQTAVTQAGTTTTSPGGFLAQRTNSGSWDRNRFSLIPQFDASLGLKMTDTWTVSVGYSLLYWGQVLRATEQIDPVLNPGLLPPEQVPLTGELRPQTLLHESDYVAHGITIGLEKRW